MITFLDGRLDEKHPTRLVVDVGGVGYEVFVPLSTFDALPPINERCRILVHDYVREDQHSLFGFLTEKERQMFSLLMNVTGIGPRLALSALSGMTVRELVAAVVAGDTARLNSISGVGKKMAERIVIELRDKIPDSEALSATAEPAGPTDAGSRDAIMALISLGYKQADAQKMVARVGAASADMSVEEIIRRALGGGG